MVTYKAMYKFHDEGVHASVLDFPARSVPGPIGKSAPDRRQRVVDMAETNLLLGEPLPRPDPTCTDEDADLEEPIYLLLTATHQVKITPVRLS